MQLDHVTEGVVHEDLLGLGSDHPARDPEARAEPLQLLLRLLDVRHGEGHVRVRGILARALRELRLAVHAHEMDLRGASHVHPVAVDGRDVRPARIGIEPEHVVIEGERLLDVGLRRTDADAVVVELKHFDGHGDLP